MSGPGIVCRTGADVPGGDDWLGPRERAAQAQLHAAPRREAWRLGRWTAKTALAAWPATRAADRAEVLAAGDGAPEAWLGDRRLPVELSISHRAGWALAAVGAPGVALGCDAEVIEPRSPAFVREWLAPSERELLDGASDAAEASLLANLCWAGKEASAKVRRGGLRLDVRAAVVVPEHAGERDWRPLRVAWPDGSADTGWWCVRQRFVLVLAAAMPIAAPQPLAAGELSAAAAPSPGR